MEFVSHLWTHIARFLQKKPSSLFRMDCNNKNKFLCYLYMKKNGVKKKAITNLWRRAEQRFKADVRVLTVSSGWAANFQTIEASPRLLESARELNSASDRSENSLEALGLWAISNHLSFSFFLCTRLKHLQKAVKHTLCFQFRLKHFFVVHKDVFDLTLQTRCWVGNVLVYVRWTD